jgi:hypothetical protein
MRLCVLPLLTIVAVLSGAACRQADGPVPVPDANTQEELKDVTKDLLNVVNKDPQAPQDLTNDLNKYNDDPEERAPIDELTRRVVAVLPSAKLSEQSAQQLAQSLWVTVTARQMSERQRETLQNDMQSLLTSVGVPDANAQQVAAQVGEVQRAINDRPRRWYEVF